MLINTEEQLNQIPDHVIRAKVHYRGGIWQSEQVETHRVVREHNGSIFIYGKGKKRYGHRIANFAGLVTAIEIPIVRDSEEIKWRKSWEKALSMLEASGLWDELKEDIKLALDIGYEKICKANEIYWKLNYEDTEAALQKIKEIDNRFIAVNDKGDEYISASFIWAHKPVAKIKKMYFGKSRNKFVLEQIANAMAHKAAYDASERAGYDVSFEYRPDRNKAFYSEEYRGCGNGHYYLALNATHALFYEDD